MLGDLFGVESLLLVSLLALDSRQVLFVAPVLWLPTLVWKDDDERVHMGTKRVSLRLRAVREQDGVFVFLCLYLISHPFINIFLK